MVVLLENIDLRQKNNSIYEKIKENTTQLKLFVNIIRWLIILSY